MKINDDHLYHGAAITQIAEHEQFTAINSFKHSSGISRSAFKVNDGIGVFLKYATAAKKPFNEYVFNFRQEHIDELKNISSKSEKVFIALVCVKSREICCLPYEKLLALIQRRRKAKGDSEEQYQILASLESGKAFRVYINAPAQKKTYLGSPIIIARNNFPNSLFD